MADDKLQSTLALPPPPDAITVRKIRLTIVSRPLSGGTRLPDAIASGRRLDGGGEKPVLESTSARIAIGSHELNDVVIDHATVSRFHCEIRLDRDAAIIHDLGSKNGTIVDGLRVREAYLRPGCLLQLGSTTLRFDAVGAEQERIATATRFGSLVGVSAVMRRAMALLAKAAATDVTLLLDGETGTGKGRAAEAVHRASTRANAPFVVVDCSAIPANLLESELFGHEKGAFTSAHERRIGAFEEASGGTLFLDEIGEIPIELQPKLLRALENREVRRVGANRFMPVDLRVIAATNRDLRAEVNVNRFRSDLYYRLAVARITLPALRERREDIPALVDELLHQLRVPPATAARLKRGEVVHRLQQREWPGNVRELRNYLERSVAFADDDLVPEPIAPEPAPAPGEVVPYTTAKKHAQDAFERAYLADLLQRFDRVSQAAAAAGVDRVYLYRLLRRHGMKPPA
ncbi:MAG TPA: sigma 54-interacting transcriptional regulator [Kofleriaceae bacterium]|nr:sigma 54-interacting transcriptional regulator [Kofleriaceae bacterium]